MRQWNCINPLVLVLLFFFKDEDGNPLETEYGESSYKDHQTFTIQVSFTTCMSCWPCRCYFGEEGCHKICIYCLAALRWRFIAPQAKRNSCKYFLIKYFVCVVLFLFSLIFFGNFPRTSSICHVSMFSLCDGWFNTKVQT